MELHANANWWGLWWLALFATLSYAAGRVPPRPTKRAPDTGAHRSPKCAR